MLEKPSSEFRMYEYCVFRAKTFLSPFSNTSTITEPKSTIFILIKVLVFIKDAACGGGGGGD